MQSAVSGLNRGLAANEGDLQKADAAAKEIEDIGGLVDLSVDLDKLQGRWKLIYSSAFSSRTLGGSRPGPPTRRLLPLTLGQVCYQNCSIVLSFTFIVVLIKYLYPQLHVIFICLDDLCKRFIMRSESKVLNQVMMKSQLGCPKSILPCQNFTM